MSNKWYISKKSWGICWIPSLPHSLQLWACPAHLESGESSFPGVWNCSLAVHLTFQQDCFPEVFQVTCSWWSQSRASAVGRMLPEKKYKARIMKKLAKKNSGMGYCRFWMRTNCCSRIAEFGEPIKNEYAIQMFVFCNCLGQQGAKGQNFNSNASYPVAVCFGSAVTPWITFSREVLALIIPSHTFAQQRRNRQQRELNRDFLPACQQAPSTEWACGQQTRTRSFYGVLEVVWVQHKPKYWDLPMLFCP